MRPRLTGAAGESATPGALASRGRPLKRARRLGMGVDVAEAVAGDGFLHRALLYRGAAEFRAAIERYVRGGLSHGELVLIATSPGKGVLRDPSHDGVPLRPRGTGLDCSVLDVAGCTHPAGGKGLWLVNQVCDLVEVRSSTDGTRCACP